jgi:hypothetical protein
MAGWRELEMIRRFADAESMMLAETEGKDGLGPDAETRAEFYEAWGDSLTPNTGAEEKYRESHYYWAIFASWSTSGGEGTARVRDVNRVLEKIESFKGQSL